MLRHLSIRNIVLIESLDIDLSDGLCVFTGETGAGKSILLDALGFVLGGRGKGELLRHGATQGNVSACFDNVPEECVEELTAIGVDSSDSIVILRRVIDQQGKSKAFINDAPVSVATLKKIGVLLVEIHGQHDQHHLLSGSAHLQLLDAYGDYPELLDSVSRSYGQYQQLKTQLQELEALQAKASSEQDYIAHVVNELQMLAPLDGEEEQLDEKRRLLQQSGKIIDVASKALSDMSEGNNSAETALQSAQRALMRYSGSEEEKLFAAPIESIERAMIELAEASDHLQQLVMESMGGEEELEGVETRLFALREAARKYNRSVDELPAYLAECEGQLGLLDQQDGAISELKQQLSDSQAHFVDLAGKLSNARKNASKRLEKAILEELAPLKLQKTRFMVQFDALEAENWQRLGQDKVTFLASMNPGMPLQPLGSIASGGELSRFMLAFKVVLAAVKTVPTMLFDEVDTGIGGAVADAVGKRLAVLGEKLQILVVTHQPQVAAKGKQHLQVQKTSNQETTQTEIVILDQHKRLEEVARMLAGESVSEQARLAAKELLEA